MNEELKVDSRQSAVNSEGGQTEEVVSQQSSVDSEGEPKDGMTEELTTDNRQPTTDKELEGLTEQIRSALNFVISNFEKVNKVKVHYGLSISTEMLVKLLQESAGKKGITPVFNYVSILLTRR